MQLPVQGLRVPVSTGAQFVFFRLKECVFGSKRPDVLLIINYNVLRSMSFFLCVVVYRYLHVIVYLAKGAH